MCMSMHQAQFSGTSIYAGEAFYKGKYVHVLAYHNEAESYISGANAMILPIPAKELHAENVIDTRRFPKFVENIQKAARQPDFGRRGLTKSAGPASASAFAERAEVFVVGSYTVVVAKSIVAMALALRELPAEKRPEMNRHLLGSIRDLYPDQPIVAACWSGHIQPEPLLFWYEPMFPEKLYAPSLDSHDGGIPQKNPVYLDHNIAFGSTLNPIGPQQVKYHEVIPSEVIDLLPTKVVGMSFATRYPNGDFHFNTASFKTGMMGVTMTRSFPGLDVAQTIPIYA